MRHFYLIFWLISGLTFCQTHSLFEQANSQYNSGDYSAAAKLYEQLLDRKLHSPELYFNLGNCYYKLNQVGPSIYYYEKALMLKPEDKDVLHNLDFAKKMTVDVIEEVPTVGFIRVKNNIMNMFSLKQWSIICIVLMFSCVLLFLAYYLAAETKTKRLYFVLEILSVVLLVISFTLSTQKNSLVKTLKFGVVFSQEIEIKSEPNLKSDTAFLLHEGTKVELVETYGNSWTKIKLGDGKTGWILNDTFKAL